MGAAIRWRIRQASRALASQGSPPSAATVRRMMTRPIAKRTIAMRRATMGWEEVACTGGMKTGGLARSGLPRRVLDHGQLFERRRRSDANRFGDRQLLRRV